MNIFVSYTLHDGCITINLLKSLQDLLSIDNNVFIDALHNDSPDGLKQRRIECEIYNADKIIVLESPSVYYSSWVKLELNLARNLGKPIETMNYRKIAVSQHNDVRHKVFVSYHHANDQWYKDRLVEWAKANDIFIDKSVELGDISDDLSDEEIRTEIRDNYLSDSTVTILLVGTETKNRKHIDWELYSSMFDGKVNHKSGILVILLPSVNCNCVHAAHENEKTEVFDHIHQWETWTNEEYDEKFACVPPRILDQIKAGAKVSIINWKDLTVGKLRTLLDNAYNDRDSFKYDFSRKRYKINHWRE